MKKLDILIAEDVPGAALKLKSVLKEKGHNIIKIVGSGSEALNTAYEMNPDIVLMDINMKGKITGLQAAEELMNNFIPVLFVTTERNKYNVQSIKSCREDDFLQYYEIVPSKKIINN